MMYDNGIFLMQFEFKLPVLGVLMDVWDWNAFRDCQGSFWNRFCALNPPLARISELSFFNNFSSLSIVLLRSFLSIVIRVLI